MDYDVLRAELALPAYAGLTDKEASDLLNAKNIASKKPIPTIEVEKYLVMASIWLPIKLSTDPIALVTMATLDKFGVLDVPKTDVEKKLSKMMDGLISINLLDDTQKLEILAMGDVTISRSTEIKLGVMREKYVRTARNS